MTSRIAYSSPVQGYQYQCIMHEHGTYGGVGMERPQASYRQARQSFHPGVRSPSLKALIRDPEVTEGLYGRRADHYIHKTRP
jgi:hypothetical protein